MKKNITAIIPARAGSKGLKGKNIRELFGKTMLQRNIELLKEIDRIDRVIVSTDSEEYRQIAIAAGAEAPFLRPPELSADYATTEDALKHAILWLKENENYLVDILVFQQVNDLFKRKEWIEKCIDALLEDDTLDSAFVAQIEHKNYWIENDGRFERLSKTGHIARQLKQPLYREDTGLASATRARLLVEENRRLGDRVKIIPHDEFCIDIHDEFDFKLAELLIENFEEFKKFK
ncbi:MAG: acylneuraminate cytidylyltransferase family protein [bacterium]|nr:acylneuraminate cytidylyltransferase family protein [bacterium]